MDENIREAELNKYVNEHDPFGIGPIATINNYLDFAASVRGGGVQDYKAHIENSATFGNFNYGAVGAAYGISLETLLGRSIDAQIIDDIYHGEIPSGSDNPDDPPTIKAGYEYYQRGCSK